MSDQNKVVLKRDPDDERGEPAVKFRLIYDGPLLGATQRSTRAAHKHEIRRQLHPQLRQLWRTNKFLREKMLPVNAFEGSAEFRSPDAKAYWGGATEVPLADFLAARYETFGYRFVPLVVEEFSVGCALNILFLRPDPPGSVLRSGDIDNRLKTFFDALRVPRHKDELAGATAQDGEDPFFCLLEDDRLITSLSLETDMLLDPPEDHDANWVRMVVTVEIRPYLVTVFNSSFL